MDPAKLDRALRVVAAVAAVLGTAPHAFATPCDGVDRKLTEAQKPRLAREIAKQLKTVDVKVLQVFRDSDWAIIYVAPPDSDETFVFYAGDPAATHYVTKWSGAAARSEEGKILRWVEKNAPGIPSRLARCFAWHVAKDRDM